MTVLITGAVGFTAKHLIRRLKAQVELRIVGTDLVERVSPSLGLDGYRVTNLQDYAQTRSLVQLIKPRWIFHLTGLSRGSAFDLYGVNTMATLNLLEAVRIGCPKAGLLLVGSAAEYGSWPASEMPLGETHECHPLTAYGISKYAMTLAALDFVRQYGLKVVVARSFNLLGAGLPTSLVVAAIAERIKASLRESEPVITVGNLHPQRDFIAVEDAVEAYVRLLESEAWGEVFNVCSGQPVPIQSVVETLVSLAPKPVRVVVDPVLQRPNDPVLVIGDPSKLQHQCGFQMRISLREALQATWNSAIPQGVSRAIGAAETPIPTTSHTATR